MEGVVLEYFYESLLLVPEIESSAANDLAPHFIRFCITSLDCPGLKAGATASSFTDVAASIARELSGSGADS